MNARLGSGGTQHIFGFGRGVQKDYLPGRRLCTRTAPFSPLTALTSARLPPQCWSGGMPKSLKRVHIYSRGEGRSQQAMTLLLSIPWWRISPALPPRTSNRMARMAPFSPENSLVHETARRTLCGSRWVGVLDSGSELSHHQPRSMV